MESQLSDELVVRVTDADGRPVLGTTVAWRVTAGGGSLEHEVTTTDADGLASNRWTLGSEVGEQVATAAVGGVGLVEFAAEGRPAPLTPESDTEISGTVQASEVRIPEGVTVRLSEDATIEASEAVEIGGTIEGDCTGLRVRSGSDVTISGAVRTPCSDPASQPEGAAFEITADGDITLEEAEFVLSGDVMIRHAGFSFADMDELEGRAGPGADAGRRAQSSARDPEDIPFDFDCRAENVLFHFEPRRSERRTGDGDGRDGADFRFGCHDVIRLDGGVTIIAQHGAHGADAEESAPEDVDAISGSGGDGGDIFLAAPAIVARFGNTLRSGDGGNGGAATATTEPRAEGDAAPRAYAVNIQGGWGGEVTLFGEERGIATGGTLEIVLGRGGDGGDAEATAADGHDATDTKEAQDGGDAASQGGEGGAGGRLRTLGSVAGDFVISGGEGGDGGDAEARPGRGGNGNSAFPNGGEGGNVLQPGEVEPSEVLTNPNGSLPGPGGFGGWDHTGEQIARGGDGGTVTFAGGWGGDGWDDCNEEAFSAGGAGGKGGDVAGSTARGGFGAPDGESGDMVFRDFSVGGGGGDGLPPGDGGEPGTEVTFKSPDSERIEEGDNFEPGPDGDPCPRSPTVTIQDPEDGAVVHENNPVPLVAEIDDPDGDASDDAVVWTSDQDGEIGRGAVTEASDLSPGPHVVVAKVTDEEGQSASDQVEIRLNLRPAVDITSPSSGQTFQLGELIRFRGSATDAEDGALPSDALTWESSLDGVLGTGPAVDRGDLSEGQHRISLSAVDSDGAPFSESVSIEVTASGANRPPEVAILSPADGSVVTVGEEITVEGRAEDPEDGPIDSVDQIRAEAEHEDGTTTDLLFSDGEVGDIEAGAFEILNTGSDPGTITYRVFATDSEGATSSDEIDIRWNDVPTLEFTSPEPGSAFTLGDRIVVEGTAEDHEDGPITSADQISVVGVHEDGSEFPFELDRLEDGFFSFFLDTSPDDPAGELRIGASVEDSDGAVAESFFDVFLEAEASGPKPIFFTQTDASSGVVRSVFPDDPGNTQAVDFIEGEFSNGMRIAFDPDPFAVIHREITDLGPPIQYDIQGHVLTMEDDGSNRQQVTDVKAFYRRGGADPAGSRLVLESDRDDPQGDGARAVLNDVFVMNVDGSGLTRVIDDAGFPSFTPSGRLVYSTDADADDRFEIRIADDDGADASLLIDDTDTGSWEEAVVSPDGTKIAVTRIDMDTFQRSIHVGDFDGTTVTNLQVVAAPTDDFEPGSMNPTWSPDSQQIAFTSTRSGDQEIWLMDADGSNKVNLSQSSSTADFHPFWQAP